MKMCIV